MHVWQGDRLSLYYTRNSQFTWKSWWQWIDKRSLRDRTSSGGSSSLDLQTSARDLRELAILVTTTWCTGPVRMTINPDGRDTNTSTSYPAKCPGTEFPLQTSHARLLLSGCCRGCCWFCRPRPLLLTCQHPSACYDPSRHETSTQCGSHAGPASQTLA